MAASTQTVALFAREQGVSTSKVKEWIRQGVVPELAREDENCMQMVNKALFDELVKNNMIMIPCSERSVKHKKTSVKKNEK